MISDWKLPDSVKILPSAWKQLLPRQGVQHQYHNRITGLFVICGLENHGGKWWLHVSCSYPDKMPSFEELKEIKQIFVGRNKKAIQVFPSEKEWVSIHPFCLHLFSADKDGLPDFTHEGGI